MSRQRWLFQAVDTWFFREARAHEAVGVGQLDSQFPPPVSTLMGAVRTALGDLAGIDWQRFATEQEYFNWLGDGGQLGAMSVNGPHLYLADKPLYAVPADLLAGMGDDAQQQFSRLRIGEPVRSDLGFVALPELNDAPLGSKPLAGVWLTSAGMARWQAGECPRQDQLVWRKDHISNEPRLGIGRDNRTATVQEGLLYQTLHLRFHSDSELRIGLELDGVPEEVAGRLPSVTGLRLGGEGREAHVSIEPLHASQVADVPHTESGDRGLILMLETPGVFLTDGQAQWCLPGFTAVQNEAGLTTHWQGSIADVELKLISVAMDRSQRVGGWDQRQRKPKAVTSRVAPGSLFYCELADPSAGLQGALEALEGQQVGEDQAWGMGRLRVGRWR